MAGLLQQLDMITRLRLTYYHYLNYLLHPSSATLTKGWQAAASSDMRTHNRDSTVSIISFITSRPPPLTSNNPHKTERNRPPKESHIQYSCTFPLHTPNTENHAKSIYIQKGTPVVHMHPMQGTVRCTPQ